MSLLPAFRAEIDKNLTETDIDRLLQDVRGLRGVASVAFNRAAPDDAGAGYLHVTHFAGQDVQRRVAAMTGVTRVVPARF